MCLNEYNEQQREAITHNRGSCIVIAPPGSGKTSVITKRTQYLIERHGVNPANILVITFTKAASKEMKIRFQKITGTKYSHVTFGTFHGIFFSILKHAYGISSSNIISDFQKKEIIKGIADSLDCDVEDEENFLEDILSEVSEVKNARIKLENYYSKSCSTSDFRNIFCSYRNKLRELRLLDFDDMLVYCYELFEKRPDILKGWQKKFEYILIDEFQDINQIQFDIVKKLVLPQNNLFVVGDDDQSIYRFRGAKPEIMLNFSTDFPEAVKIFLKQNYRSTKNILKDASCLISKNLSRYKKKIETSNEEGEQIKYNIFSSQIEQNRQVIKEIVSSIKKGLKYSDTAILFRTNTQPRLLAEMMLEYNMPFSMRDKIPNIYEHWIAKNIFAYINISKGSQKRSDFLQIINRPKRYISRACINSIEISKENLFSYYQDKEWMCEYVEQLWFDFKMIKPMRPYAAINYIRKSIRYDDYLKEYADYRNLDVNELYQILDEIQEVSKEYENCESWFLHIENYTKELKRQQQSKEQSEKDSISILTMHSAKGLEFEHVYILDASEGIIPHPKAQLDAEIEEERRMFYVAMTRAKKQLNIYSIRERFQKDLKVSRFIEEAKKI